MPHDAAIDAIFHRHTEHGQPRFHTRRHGGSFASVHLEHHGGFAYAAVWETFDLYPFVQSRRPRPTREEVSAIAGELVERLVALQSSNPASKVHAHSASALVLLDEWCILMGDYYVYTRTGGAGFEPIVPPIGSRTPDDVLQAMSTHPTLESVARNTVVHPTGGLPFHDASQCIHDLHGVDELIASTLRLHETAEWSEIARLPLDTVESTGRVVTAMRNDGVARGTDHIVVRWRNRRG
jgi:hypothetical protein